MNLLTTLPPATGLIPITGMLGQGWMLEHDTARRTGFAAVFDTDIELLKPEVGCPVIDVEGCIRGIAITSRGPQ